MYKDTLTMFKDFMVDETAWDAYVTGAAGTGKTTSLRDSVEYCLANGIPHIVCSFTHKACGILRNKLPAEANVTTLHSFLKKRPSINQHATKLEHLNSTSKHGAAEEDYKVMFLDEYSVVGEKDGMDIVEAQDRDYDGIPALKVVWIGDSNQLPPVGDQQYVKPRGDYQVTLTKIWRNDNPLQIPLTALISYLNGATPQPLESVDDYFIRDKNIVTEFQSSPEDDKIILAYTNKRVQSLNEEIEGKTAPLKGQSVFSPTTNKRYTFVEWVTPSTVTEIQCHYDDPLQLGSKYKTLEWLVEAELCKFALLIDEDGEDHVWAVEFGHYDYKIAKENLEIEAVHSNKAIEDKHRGYKAAGWAKANSRNPLARARSKAWRDCLSFKDYAICIDFTHATTVHKSQGSTYVEVYLDTDDLAICADKNFDMYIKLMYVGISRASHKVVTP